MASKVAKAAKGGVRAWLMPEINEIKVQLSELKGEMKSLSTKGEEMDKRLGENDRRLSEKLDEVNKSFSWKIDDLDKRLYIVQRLSVLGKQNSESLKERSLEPFVP